MDVLVRRKRALSPYIILGIASATLLLAGCGGDESEEAVVAPAPTPGPQPGSGNRAPTISGAPTSMVLQNNTYSFTPTAADADGDTLTFSVTNLPAWATFNSSTGRLRGTPTAAQIGTYSNISITASDGSATTGLAPFSIQVVATATGTALLMWTPPTQNTDGSALTNLSGYKVYWGQERGDYTNSVTINNAGLSSYLVEQLTPATWYFALTAVNSAGVESAYSSIASKQVL